MSVQRRQFIYLLGVAGGLFAIGGSKAFQALMGHPLPEIKNSVGRTLILKYKNPSGQSVQFEWVDYKKIEELYDSYVAQGRILNSHENRHQDSAEFVLNFSSNQDLKDYFAQLCQHSSRAHRKVIGVDLSVEII